MRNHALALSLVCALAGCATPPTGAYVGVGGASRSGPAIDVGRNSSGESCHQLQGGAPGLVNIYCGSWAQPAAHIRAAGPISSDGLTTLATVGDWRQGLDLRYDCGPPERTSVLGGEPAVLLRCTRRIGGWPQIAVVAAVGGRGWLADGILPTLPVIERAIGVLSGHVDAAAARLPPSAADALLANQLAARAFSAGDVGQYEDGMALGARANLADNFAAAEIAYRAALALQQKALGRDNPDTATALMHLALQVSDQSRFAESDTLFQRAEALAPRATDRAATARLLHYRAVDALNQGRDDAALELLERAENAYGLLIPPEILAGGSVRARPVSAAPGGAAETLANGRLMVDPGLQSALMGVIETRRYRAILLRKAGRPADSAAAAASAQGLAQANGMLMPLVSARLARTEGATASAAEDAAVADARLARSAADFGQILPHTRPLAVTALLQAKEYVREGRADRALLMCQTGTTLLRELHAGIDASLLAPCLAAYFAEAEQRPGQRQKLLAVMFETAELTQDSITIRQIAAAAARLAASARDPRISEAIRRQQNAADTLAELYRARDALVLSPAPGSPPLSSEERNPAKLDQSIAAAQSDLSDADAALQSAAPNYAQLVEEVVPAADVLNALAPGEAFAAIVLTGNGGWTFLLRDGQIDAAPVRAPAVNIGELVRRVRASIEADGVGQQPFDIAAAQAIYQAVLEPVENGLEGASALVVAPSGPLLSLPFAVLLTGRADPSDLAGAPWLVRRMTIAHVPAAANFVALRRIASGSRAVRPWLGFGNVLPVTLAQAERTFPSASCADSAKLLAGLPRLAFSQLELEAARKTFGADRSDIMLGSTFTAANVVHAKLKDYRILHFATHALLPAELRCQSEPAIVTSDPPGASDAAGALLSASAVIGLDLDANVVVLSACNSGGPNGTGAGDSLSGLARAFFYAGARSMLVTHWSVNDQTSAYLVADTLRRYAAGADGGLAGALAGAQRAILDAAGKEMPAELAHPFFWASFAVAGEGRARSVVAERLTPPGEQSQHLALATRR